MSLVLRRMGIENFRKFREPLEIGGLTEGLNIVVEPNETGKSTVMEAVRAAMFLRHSSKSELIKSFQPYGEAIAPQIELDFDLDGKRWHLLKRFLLRTSAELTGPDGKRQDGDAAEVELQRLLGFKQAKSLDAQKEMLGSLGMLWVAQTEGLSIAPPGNTVRDAIGATLEGEAGAMMGSAAFERVNQRVQTEFRGYWTETGREAGKLKDARARLEQAEATRAEAQARLDALEAAHTDLEGETARLAAVQRDLADEQDAAQRKQLEERLEAAKGAAQRLATREAEELAARGIALRLEELAARHADLLKARDDAEQDRAAAAADLEILNETIAKARLAAVEAGQALDAARTARQETRAGLEAGRALEQAHRRSAALAAARLRHQSLVALETERAVLLEQAKRRVPDDAISQIERLASEITGLKATLQAGGTRVALIGAAPGLTLDGAPMPGGEWTLTREARIGLPGGGEIVLTPPVALEGAQASLAETQARHDALLSEWRVDNLSAARAMNDAAREAASQVGVFDARIKAETPEDSALGLAAGADALKAFIASCTDEEVGEAPGDLPSLAELETASAAAEQAFIDAEARNTQANDDARKAERDAEPLTARLQSATLAKDHAAQELDRLAANPDFADLDAKLAEARGKAAEARQKLEEARTDAKTLDPDAITRQIETLGKRRKAAEDRHRELTLAIAALNARIESEGGKGLAERAATAAEEEDAARAALDRISTEADTLKLLRQTLQDSAAEMSRTVAGPVAKRAARYVGRILPGGEPGFDADLALATIRRGTAEEETARLSRGTQEQLAILSRLAFADLLQEEGKPVSLMLDDPLVYSDDVRLDAMIDLLTEVSQRMQVIVFTCRERAFRHVEGNRIALAS